MRPMLLSLFVGFGLLSSGTSMPSARFSAMKSHGTIVLADGTDPLPPECGLWDICRKPEAGPLSSGSFSAMKSYGTVLLADGTDPLPPECGLWDICRQPQVG